MEEIGKERIKKNGEMRIMEGDQGEQRERERRAERCEKKIRNRIEKRKAFNQLLLNILKDPLE